MSLKSGVGEIRSNISDSEADLLTTRTVKSPRSVGLLRSNDDRLNSIAGSRMGRVEN